MVGNFINKGISFFANKKKILIISLSIIILLIVGFLYNTYATSTGVALGNQENTYDILLNDSSNTVSVPARSSKTVYYQFSNTNKGTIKYHIGFISDNVIAKVWWDSEDTISGTIEYGEYKFIKLKLINESTEDDTITIKPVLGFKDGGDLVVPSDTTLVTDTINEVNTMSITPTDALTALGIDKANVKELSFVNDNIPSSNSLGSTNMNDDGSVKLWYTNSDTSGQYNVFIGSDNGITSFPEDSSSLFESYTKLTSIDLKYIDTFNVIKMFQMFFNCTKLGNLDLSNLDTSKVKNMRSLFYGCQNLVAIDLSSFNTSSVENMMYLFYNCKSLQLINLSSFDTLNVEYMNGMFYGCSGLKQLNVSNFDTSKVKSMAQMFSNCSNLESLDLYNFNTSKVINMREMFYSCTNIKVLDLSNFDTHLVTDTNRMFCLCQNLAYLNISNFDMHHVIDANRMFSFCDKLVTINFGNNFDLNSIMEDKTSKVEETYKGLYRMFYNDSKLSSDTLNSILNVLSTAGSGVQTKTLSDVGLNSSQANTATTLSNYQMFTDAGWTTGY